MRSIQTRMEVVRRKPIDRRAEPSVANDSEGSVFKVVQAKRAVSEANEEGSIGFADA